MMGERHYAYPDRGDTPYSECVEENAGSRASSSVERWVAKNLSKAGFEVTRHARVHASIAPFCGVAPIRLSPDIIVNRHTVVEVDYPADGGGGPSHVRGFPARDMVRLDFFRVAISWLRRRVCQKIPLIGGDRWTRTTDSRRMKALLYRLSYTAKV